MATELLNQTVRLGADSPRGRTGTPPRRLSPAVYRRRRVVVFAAVVAACGALAATAQVVVSGLGDGGPASAATGTAPNPGSPRSVVAASGDSLWSIARSRHGNVDFERYLDELIELNGGTTIVVGQLVRLP